MIIRGFDEKKYYTIAKASGSKQASDDVKYARLAFYKRPGAEYAERIDDDSYILCYRGLNVFRIIGLATREDMKGKGLAGMLLKRALNFARMGGVQERLHLHKGRQRILSMVR